MGQDRRMRIEDATLRLVDLVDARGQITGLEAEGVTFTGPAIIMPSGANRLERCTWETGRGGIDAIAWDIDPARSTVVGVVRLERCTLVRCRFTNIGLALPPAQMQQFLRNMTV
jgi:hypothetical protein